MKPNKKITALLTIQSAVIFKIVLEITFYLRLKRFFKNQIDILLGIRIHFWNITILFLPTEYDFRRDAP